MTSHAAVPVAGGRAGDGAHSAGEELPARRLMGVLRALTLGGVVLYVVYTVIGIANGASLGSLPDWLFAGILLLAASRCLLRGALVPAQRTAWVVLGLGLLTWALGEALVGLSAASSAGHASLSLSDLAALAFYPAAYAALIVLLGAAVDRFSALPWLDGMAGALAVSALVAAFAFPSVLADAGGGLTAVATAMSYPLADLLLIAVVLFVLAMTDWRPGAVLGLVTSALVLIAAADAFALWWASTGHTGARTALDWLWPAAAALVAEAAWRPPLRRRNLVLSGARSLVIPAFFSLTALALLISGLFFSLNAAGYELAISALAILLARMVLTAIENVRMAQRSRREALTDALTGLGNRRSLMLDLEQAIEQSSPSSPTVLMLFDLDGFKRYNDTFGHPAGDALLARMGQTLEQAAGSAARPYRLGGDEFCALLTGRAADIADIVPGIVAALSEHGAGFSVAPSYGSVLIPMEATDVTLALQLADQRLYQRKGQRRRVSDVQQARDVLLQVLRERQPALTEHLSGVAGMAQGVALRLGLSSGDVDQITRGAELHDVGKMAVPEGILQKPGDLDELERALMHQHTVIGERILAAAPALAPVAALVRASHERYDGAGYPDGLAGEEIPLGARIIAVCDAYEAMTTGRPYQAAVSPTAAMAELRRCAGGQFDPNVVELFCEEVKARIPPGAERESQPAVHTAQIADRLDPNGAPVVERR